MTIAGLSMARLGRYTGARLALERALKLQPDQFDAARVLGELDMRIGNGAGAAHALAIAARLHPDDFRLWLTLGNVHHDLGDAGNAIRAYRKASELKPDDREALIGLIRDLLNLFQLDPAERALDHALKAYPDDPVFLGMKARQLCDAGRFDEAIAWADRALAKDANDHGALLARGRGQIALSRDLQAVVDLERLVSVSPNEVEAFSLIMQAETRLGRPERVSAARQRRLDAQTRVQLMGELTRLMELHPDDPELRCRYGRAALEGGATLLAARCFEAALALNPGHQEARASLEALRAGQQTPAATAAGVGAVHENQ
jgi:tetratricopeptide (TPR) repeat protein